MAQMTLEVDFPVWDIEPWAIRMSSDDGRYNTDLKLFGLLSEILHYKYTLIYMF